MPVPRRRAALAAVLAALALAAPAGAGAADCPGADATPADQGTGPSGQATICLLNTERAARGLPALAEHPALTQASQAYSELMVAKAFFAHVTPGGLDLVARLTTAGYLTGRLDSWAVGENLAWGQGSLATPRAIVTAWLQSSGHRANILSADYAEIGIGIAAGTPTAGPAGATYTTDFGRRHESAPAPRTTPPAPAAGSSQPSSTTAQTAATKKRSRARSRARARAQRARAARLRTRRHQRARHRHRPHRRAVYRARVISG